MGKGVSILFLLIFIASAQIAFSQTYIPGTTYFDSTGYVEYRAGNLPIIISAPHGGIEEPDFLPDLPCDGPAAQFIDAYTKQIAEATFDGFFEETGCYPHVIINLLHKKKFEANRNLELAACGNPIVESAWYAYHEFIDSAKAQIVIDHGKGLFLDLHSHSHDIERIELGYLLSTNELQLSNSDLNNDGLIEESSIRNLVENNIQNLSHTDLLKGQFSFGTLMDNKGFPGVPSSQDEFPQENEPYFTGGYNTQRHGSRDNNDGIDGIQLEFNQNIRFDADIRAQLVESLITTSIEYLTLHYNDQFSTNFCNLVSDVSNNFLASEINLYPNPASTYIHIESGFNHDGHMVFNIMGELMMEVDHSTGKIPIEFLPDGLYFVAVYRKSKIIELRKFIKQ